MMGYDLDVCMCWVKEISSVAAADAFVDWRGFPSQARLPFELFLVFAIKTQPQEGRPRRHSLSLSFCSSFAVYRLLHVHRTRACPASLSEPDVVWHKASEGEQQQRRRSIPVCCLRPSWKLNYSSADSSQSFRGLWWHPARHFWKVSMSHSCCAAMWDPSR